MTRDYTRNSVYQKKLVVLARHVSVCAMQSSARRLVGIRGARAANQFPHVEPRIAMSKM